MSSELMKAFASAAGIPPQEWEAMLEQSKMDSRRASWPEVDALLLADWKWELPEIVNCKPGQRVTGETEPWQWYWRAPPKRVGGKGRKYWSTTQAYNALMRQKGKL